MNDTQTLLLNALRAALSGGTIDVPADALPELMRLASAHAVTPTVSAAVKDLPEPYRRTAFRGVSDQLRRDVTGLRALDALQKSGVRLALLKGPVCASLWPDPLLRLSSDLDVCLPEGHAEAVSLLQKAGFAVEHDDGVETSLLGPAGCLFELHGRLVDPEDAPLELPREPFGRMTVYGMTFPVLGEEDGLVYLIYHAYRHFLTGGFGVKQAVDICLCASRYPDAVPGALERLSAIRADGLARAVLGAGQLSLGIGSPCDFDENASRLLLDDMLRAGVFGSAETDRKQSARLTRGAVRGERGLLRAAFPERSYMLSKYPVLGDNPLLLPFYYAKRLGQYASDALRHKKSPAAAMRTAGERLDLMRNLGMLPK